MSNTPYQRHQFTGLMSANACARHLINDLIDTLNGSNDYPRSSVIGIARNKPTLLTLHGLFPTSLIPALDVLDRHLITRLTFQDGVFQHANTEHVDTHKYPLNADTLSTRTVAGDKPYSRSVYYVRSSAPPPSSSRGRFSNPYPTDLVSYEVRTTAWNCTCAAFIFAAYNSSISSKSTFGGNNQSGAPDGGESERGCTRSAWGGLFHGEDRGGPPLCKHLLACVLTERWTVAADMIEEKVVGREETAGWAAGWGG